MQTITKYIIIVLLSFYFTNVSAQDSIPKSKASSIESLKESIRSEERDALKIEVEEINKRVLDKEITYEDAENFKEIAAKKRALNIENRIVILENKIALHERNDSNFNIDDSAKKIKFSISLGEVVNFTGISYTKSKKSEPVKYDYRTLSGLVASVGLNNAIIDGQSLSDSPYKIGGSGFFELGFQWKTRILKNSNIARLRYGLSLQWNKYDLKDNKYFVQNRNTTTIETFPVDLKQAKFRTTNLVLPLYFEFGQHGKIEKKDRVRYITKGFKFGFGGYAGLNIGARQKLWYKDDGEKTKQKIKQDYNVNPFVYGVGTYIGYDDVSLFLKYDLSNTFKENSMQQNNISLGIRLEIE